MIIPPLNELPWIAGPAVWARSLHCDEVTVWRAANVYKTLERANPGATRPLYSRGAVMRWLGLPEAEINPAPVTEVTKETPKRRRRVVAR